MGGGLTLVAKVSGERTSAEGAHQMRRVKSWRKVDVDHTITAE